ncbi:MAG TPA: hypothetical protein VFZ09_26320 [Archangium sp.]|uniref:hypothetical protein n=1 Tax=Archangium sp. TaxID=1872627 RepID=UPI002E3820E5|nr:hypothetical protein [Archangium sp.]HEX5749774.1 hypothetical protein [Archangium sp.]
MAKHNDKKQEPASAPTPLPPPPAAPDAQPVEARPTPPELEDLELLTMEAADLGTDEPPSNIEPPPEGMTLQKAISRAWSAHGVFQQAEQKAKEAKKKAEESDRAFRDQKTRLEQQENHYKRKLNEVAEKERQLLDKEVLLTERERNAEQGFLAERRRIVEGLNAQVAELRKELDELQSTLDARRSADEADWRKRMAERDERARREAEARAAEFLAERQRFEKEFAVRRQQAQEELRLELVQERKVAQAQLAAEGEGQRAHNEAERKELQALQEHLRTKERILRSEQSELHVKTELLNEDRRAFDAKVARFAAGKVAELESDLTALRERLKVSETARDRYWKDLESRRQVDQRLGKDPQQLIDRLQQLERENSELHSQLRESLGEQSARRLSELEKERSAWLEERSVLRSQLAEAEARIGRQRIGAVELETVRSQKEALETNKKLLEAAIAELDAQVKKYTQADDKRNPMEALVAIDRNTDWQSPLRTWRPLGQSTPTLKEFAADLRDRIAVALRTKEYPDKTLYYSERDIRCFLGGLAMSRLLLLQGISGTGKTSLPLAFSQAVGADKHGHEVVEVQAGWRDRQDLLGYFNAFHRHYYATNFLQALYRAGTPTFADRPFLIILDEINLSRVEQYFADFLSALEQPEDKRRLTLLNDPATEPPRLMVEGRHLPIPPNVWFVGTANHDETTTEFADKTYDRAHIMEMPRRDPKRDSFTVKERPPREPLSYQGLVQAFDAARRDKAAEVEKVRTWLQARDGVAGFLDKRFRLGWGNRLERDAERFVPVVMAAGGTMGEAMDHLLYTKVLRKLRDRHDVRPKALQELQVELEKSWKGFDGQPERSLSLIDRELRAKQDEELG